LVGFDLTFVYLDLAVWDFVIPNTNLRDFTSGFHIRDFTSGVPRPEFHVRDVCVWTPSWRNLGNLVGLVHVVHLVKAGGSTGMIHSEHLCGTRASPTVRVLTPSGKSRSGCSSSGICHPGSTSSGNVKPIRASTRALPSSSPCATNVARTHVSERLSHLSPLSTTLGLIWENPEPPRVSCPSLLGVRY
jgi:hypothetical protein